MSEVEKHLRESKRRFKALFESDMIGIALSDFGESSPILEANEVFLNLIGYSKKDLRENKLTWEAISPERYFDIDEQKIRELVSTGTIAPFEKEYIHKEGHLVPVLVGATRISNDPLVGVCFALDISRQKSIERKKDEFIGTVSHELKTPLSVLKMQVSLLSGSVDHHLPAEELKESLAAIDSQIDRLNIMLTDLLNLARLTDTHDEVSREFFNVNKCVKKAVDDVSLTSDRKITLMTPKSASIARGSELRISRVVTNLITNAIRYSPENSKVSVKVEKDKKHIKIHIGDKGRGIAKKDQKKMFERYYRSDHVDGYVPGSSGIGLHVCREIMKQHDGSIVVDSVVGKGSTFTCVLPNAG